MLAESLRPGKARSGPNCSESSVEMRLQVRAKYAKSSAGARHCANGVARPSRGARGLKLEVAVIARPESASRAPHGVRVD